MQNVPEATRENAIKSLRGLVEISMLAMQQSGGEEQRALMENNVKQIFGKLETLSKELDSLVIGIGMDASSKALFLDFEARSVDGSDLGKKFAALKEAKSDFAGFAVADAAMTMLSSGTSDDEEVQASKTAIAGFKKAVDKSLDSNDSLTDEEGNAQESGRGCPRSRREDGRTEEKRWRHVHPSERRTCVDCGRPHRRRREAGKDGQEACRRTLRRRTEAGRSHQV